MALADAVHVGGVLELQDREAFHARKVMRLRKGEALDLVDREGLRVLGRVHSAAPDTFAVEVVEVFQEAGASPSLILVQALAKGGRDEQAIETATEVGVDQVVPWQAKRCVVRWDGKKAAAGVERWQRVLDAAAKQARRAWVPKTLGALNTTQLAGKIEELVESGALVLIAHESGADTFSHVMRTFSPSLGQLPSIMVVVGPEGGITDEELETFKEAGAVIVRMGNNVMRSSTAGPAALVALNVEMERW